MSIDDEPDDLAGPCPYCGDHTLYRPTGWERRAEEGKPVPIGGPIACANSECPSNHPPDLGMQPNPYRDGQVHVMSEQCSTCVFRPGNPMNLPPGRLKGLTDHVQETGVPFSCHQTLPYAGAEHVAYYEGAALCAGAVEAYGSASPQVQLAYAVGAVTTVKPAPPK